jgi:cytochrome P450
LFSTILYLISKLSHLVIPLPIKMIINANEPQYSIADPYPWYKWVQQEKPIFRTPDGMWMITGYEDAMLLLSDPRCSHWGQDSQIFQYLSPVEKAIAQTLHALAPGSTPAFRKQIMHQLAARTLQVDEDDMKQQADEILAGLRSSSRIEFMNDYAHPFTFGTICRVMGVPQEEVSAFSKTVGGLKGGYLSFVDEKSWSNGEDEAKKVFIDTLRRLIGLKRKKPGKDLCSAILSVVPDGDGDDSFIISLMVLLFYAGHQNMMNFMGNALVALQDRVEDQATLRESLSAAITGVDELIRYDSPLQSVILITQESINLHGTTIPAGSQLLISIGAANRDPAKFENPDQLILGRRPNHLGFGAGAFRCIGARLAQIQGGIGMHRFFAHLSAYTIAENISWSHFSVQRGPSSILLDINWNHEK